MPEAVGPAGGRLGAEEARLARAAASGDGDAFATLYERYARRAFNLALRLSGSEDDAADAVQDAFLNVMRRLPELDEGRELAFGSYLFTATRNATYDLLRRQQRSRPSDSIPDSAVPLGSGAGGLGLDPGDPDEDPDRRTLLASQREEIQEANARLPERQREALALRELEEMSYDEIAAVMEMNRNSVAQLISRARISLRDELRQTMLTSITAASADCERALPLIAMRDDRQLDPDGDDAAWLGAHLGGCETCGLAAEAMQEAGASYRLWAPVAVAPWLFRETMARAAELSGSDWGEVASRRLAAQPDPAALPGLPPAYRASGAAASRPFRRRRATLAAALALLLLGGGAAVVSALDDGSPAMPPSEPAAGVAPAEPAPAGDPPAAKAKKKRKDAEKAGASSVPVAEPEAPPASEPVAAPAPSAAPQGTESEAPRNGKGGGGGGGDLTGKEPVGRQPQSEPKPETPPTEPPAEPPAEPEPTPEREPEPTPEREPEEPEPEPEGTFSGPGKIKGNGGGNGTPAG